MKASEIQSILQSLPVNDRQTTARLSDTRRPRLTFHHLGALRKQKEARELERELYLKQVKDMYGVHEEPTSKRSGKSDKYLRKHTRT